MSNEEIGGEMKGRGRMESWGEREREREKEIGDKWRRERDGRGIGDSGRYY